MISRYHKERCEELRKIRVKIADTLGIPDVVRSEPCNYSGECKGTCPACYMEERALLDKIYELSKNGMMDMIFGDSIKVLKENTMIPNNDMMGDIVPMEGLVVNRGFEEDKDGTDGFIPSNKPLKPVTRNDKPSDFDLFGNFGFETDGNFGDSSDKPFNPPPFIPMSGQILTHPYPPNVKKPELIEKPVKETAISKLSKKIKGNRDGQV